MKKRLAATFVVTVATLLGVAGCRRNDAAAKGNGSTPAASASASVAAADSSAPLSPAAAAVASYNALPFSPEHVASLVNPGGLPVYDGPTGSVRGVITLKGDPPPDRVGAKPPPRCGREAVEFYQKAFRVGPKGELADVVVGVTDYKAYIPPKQPGVEMTIRGCAFSQRTVVMTFGQKLEIKNLDQGEGYLPHLEGARAPALRVAMPQGEAINIYPPRPGIFHLYDDLRHPWMTARVFALKYSTTGVSDVNGVFKIDNLPVGEVKVSAFHPDLQQTRERVVEIREGKTTEVNFEITYSAAAAASASASGSAAPKAPIIH